MNNKKFTDLFIKRPVLAMVVSLLIFLVGLRSLIEMPLQQFPSMKSTNIIVTTAYPGASASVIQGFITSIISQSVASAEGLDYLTSTSQEGMSSITAHIRLNYDPNAAMTNVSAAVAQVTGQLPKDAMQPVILKQTGDTMALMYIGFTSKDMTQSQIADYVSRAVQPTLETRPGVGQAQILGNNTPAMRIWLNPNKMAAFNVTTNDIVAALQSNNYQSSAGSIRGNEVLVNLNAETGTQSPEEFSNIIIRKNTDNSVVRIGDIAKVALGAQDYSTNIIFNGESAIFMAIYSAPGANPLDVINNVRSVLPAIAKNYPPGFHAKVVYDATNYIRASIHEVIQTIIEATFIVVLVIFLFLGSPRTVIIPVITIPLCLIGVCTFMYAAGFSVNLLTLLSFVLAIGLVVDDAIVVVENVYRHVEEGKSPYEAALLGAREISTPVISMSITLAAVYAPIAFMSGLTGALFTEFAMTLAMAVIVSGVVALTLSPMMCSKLLTADIGHNRFVQYVDHTFEKIKNFYKRRLTNVLTYRPVIVVFAMLVLASCIFFVMTTQNELAPKEDQGFLIGLGQSPQYANISYTSKYMKQTAELYQKYPDAISDYFLLGGISVGAGVDESQFITGAVLKPWSERKISQDAMQAELQKGLYMIPGAQVAVIGLPPLPGVGFGMPVQFVVTTIGDFKLLDMVSQTLQQSAMKSGLFLFVNTNLQITKPQLNIVIDRNKAADLGITMDQIGNTLSTALGGNYINLFNQESRSYRVIPQVQDPYRFTLEDINQYYVRDANNQMIPLGNLVKLNVTAEPNMLYQFQQLNSVTIQGIPMPGHTIPECLQYLKTQMQQNFPSGFNIDYDGESRQFMQVGNGMLYTFLFALIVIFLVLAAQFESFRDPLIILISVPLALSGALLFMNIGFSTMNIYTEIGLISLIGLISKHGILMVEFANQLQKTKGLNIHDAIVESASIRLRPILMTTAAMVFGVMPLIVSSGPGAHSRFDMGLVIATGMIIGTCFTLFVVPTMYTYLANHHKTDADDNTVAV